MNDKICVKRNSRINIHCNCILGGVITVIVCLECKPAPFYQGLFSVLVNTVSISVIRISVSGHSD